MARVWTLFFALFLLSAGTSLGQRATVYGVVTETLDGEVYPIPFAKIAVTGETYSSGPIVPDLDGLFRISGIPPGKYVVTVSALGFDTLERGIILSPADSVEARVSLGTGESAGIVLMREYVSDAPASDRPVKGTE